jgi:hypothetical protein
MRLEAGAMNAIDWRTLAICAAIIAGPKLGELERDKSPVAIRDVVYDAIVKAETVMNQVRARYPLDRVPGK